MLIWTAKLDRRKAGLVLGAAVLCAALAAWSVLGAGAAETAAAVSPKGVKTAEDRAAYLAAWGWQTPSDAAAVEELELPERFGDEYSQYLELQTGQGFDLAKYAGKRVRRYTYDLLNYPGGTQAQAHLLLYKNTVIGGEVLGEGFLHGLAMPDPAPQ